MAMFDGSLPALDPLALSGDVVSAGSSTVFPLAEAMVARFQDEVFSGQITIDSDAGYWRKGYRKCNPIRITLFVILFRYLIPSCR
jgi:hypothetical protein